MTALLAPAALAAVLLGSSAEAGALRRAPGGEGPLDRVHAVLRGAPADEEDLAQALARLGPDTGPALLDLVLGEGLERLLAAAEEGGERGPWRCPPDRIPELALRALARRPADEVVALALAAAEEEPADLDRRLGLVRLLGALGSGEALPALARLGDGMPPSWMRSRAVRAELRRAWAAGLSDARADELAAVALGELAGDHLALVLEAAREAGAAALAPALFDLLGRDGGTDLAVLEVLAELEAGRPWQRMPPYREVLRARLRSLDAYERARAAAALGVLGGASVVEELVPLVADRSAMVRRAALDALRVAAGLRLDDAPETWRTWWEDEERWWLRQGGDHLDALADREPHRTAEALAALSRHRLHRHEAARAIAESLAHYPPARARAALAALRQMGSLHAVPALVAALGRVEEELVPDVRTVLAALTGVSGPEDAPAWREALGLPSG